VGDGVEGVARGIVFELTRNEKVELLGRGLLVAEHWKYAGPFGGVGIHCVLEKGGVDEVDGVSEGCARAARGSGVETVELVLWGDACCDCAGPFSFAGVSVHCFEEAGDQGFVSA
jgi:hypothetical protein